MLDKNIPIDAAQVAIIAKHYLVEVGAGELLEDNGGVFKAGSTWCSELLHELGLTRRKCTTQASKLPEDWEKKGERLTMQACSRSQLDR